MENNYSLATIPFYEQEWNKIHSFLIQKYCDIEFDMDCGFNWEEKKLSIIRHKMHKSLSLPIPDAVGWAVIDYIKNGRPSYFETDIIFLKHMLPFDPIGENNHMEQIIIRYMRKAGIDRHGRKRSGFYLLRHFAGSMLLEMETPLPVIKNILGHSASFFISENRYKKTG